MRGEHAHGGRPAGIVRLTAQAEPEGSNPLVRADAGGDGRLARSIDVFARSHLPQ